MKVYLEACIEALQDKPQLEEFRRLGRIFYYKYWDADHHQSVDTDELIWLWTKLVSILSFNNDLPYEIRFMDKYEFIENMREFLRFGYELLQRFDIDE